MMQKCHKKKAQFPLIALVFFVFIILSILYNERYIQEIHQNPPREGDDNGHQQSAIETVSFLNPIPILNGTLVQKYIGSPFLFFKISLILLSFSKLSMLGV